MRNPNLIKSQLIKVGKSGPFFERGFFGMRKENPNSSGTFTEPVRGTDNFKSCQLLV